MVSEAPQARHPFLLEVNARVFLQRLAKDRSHSPALTSAPGDAWRRLAASFDLLWLMGVWRRSEGSRRTALHHPDLRRAFDQALPGWTDDDVAGSPYAVAAYELDPVLGAPSDLGKLHFRLHGEGLGLVLDFVPNHLALDHPWTRLHPERFVGGDETAARQHPECFFQTPTGEWLAHGRDPYFPPWTDTVQVNFFSRELRQALIAELLAIARVADGVRCDMAMLGLNRIFAETWGVPPPEDEFWAQAIDRVRQEHPDFLFIAEAYWGTENELLELGFDFVYDKTLYDLLLAGPAGAVRQHLERGPVPAARGAHFIENHDEERAATALGHERSRAAAVAVATLPGLRFFHDGQLEGRRLRLPVQLVREPEETPDPSLAGFYDRLLEVGRHRLLQEGKWRLLAPEPESLVAWCWRARGELLAVAVNYGSQPAAGRLALPAPEGRLTVQGLLGQTGSPELSPRPQLTIELEPWGFCMYHLQWEP